MKSGSHQNSANPNSANPSLPASVPSDLKLPRPAQRAEGAAQPRGQVVGGVAPECRNGGEVAERSEAGEGLPRFIAEGSGHPPGVETVAKNVHAPDRNGDGHT